MTHSTPPVAANCAIPLRDVREGQLEDHSAIVVMPPPLLDVYWVGRRHRHATHGIHWRTKLCLDACVNLPWRRWSHVVFGWM